MFFAFLMKKKILDSINQFKGFIKNKSFSESMESNLNDKETVETLEQETITAEMPADKAEEPTPNEPNNENSDENAPDSATNTSLEIARLQNEIAELKDRNIRLLAEFDNVRKRTAREKLEMQVTAARDIMTVLLPILDDFDRAAKNEQFTEGVNLVYQKMHSTLQSKGLSAMSTDNGTAFDADTHEAIAELPLGDDLKGKIIDTVEKGYLLHDKIIRFAKVVVGK
jgi:molecular chaperone GrpE